MDEHPSSSSLRFNLRRESPFSFKCQVCGACCSNKEIPVSPSEMKGLARRLNLSLEEFPGAYLEKRGTILRRKPDGSCIFLQPEGCSIYPERPLVCRLFPLGLIVDEAGQEHYGIMPLHPDCLGVLGEEGTVAAYLRSQGVLP